jgi:hypothetical protein
MEEAGDAVEAARGRNVSIVMGTSTKEIAKLIVLPAEATRRSMVFEAAHTSNAALDTAAILFEPVVQVGIRPVLDRLAKRRADSPWVRTVPVRRHAIRSKAHGCFRKNRLAATMFRVSLGMVSIRPPSRSTARYK